MATIYRNSYTRNGQKHYHAKWYIKYKGPDGKIRRVAGHADREATEQLARSLESRNGRTLKSSLADYEAYLRVKDDHPHTIAVNLSRIRVFNLDDLTGAAVLRS